MSFKHTCSVNIHLVDAPISRSKSTADASTSESFQMVDAINIYLHK